MSKTITYLLTIAFYAGSAHAATVSVLPYGKTPDGKEVSEYTLSNKNGMKVKVITIAADIREIDFPDKYGRLANIVLGLPNAHAYATMNDPHFGAIIGRYANRIAAGHFILDGKNYQLPLNDGKNTLHGGPSTFAQDLWTSRVIPQESMKTAAVEMSYFSPDGQNGFPGNLKTTVTYSLNDENQLTIKYFARTDKDTIVNLTNHSYFNLSGESSGNVEQQEIQIFASNYTPTDSSAIPTGDILPVKNTPLDFRKLKPIGENIRSDFSQLNYARGYDNNWVLDNYSPNDPTPKLAARVYDPKSGRLLELSTTQPGLQFYTANSLDGSVIGSSGHAYRQTDGFALEAEHFPNSPNIPSFPSTLLKKGDTFSAKTVIKLSVREK